MEIGEAYRRCRSFSHRYFTGVIYYGLIMFICVQWLLKSTQKVFALCYYLLVIVGNCWTPEMTINVNFIHNLRAGHALGEERKSKGHAL